MNFISTPSLETERLRLRQFIREDLDALYAIYRDEDVNVYLPWFPLQSRLEAEAFWEKNYVNAYRQTGSYRYAICLKSDDKPIGYVHVGGDESHDLGYGLCREFWHRGIVTEACRAVIGQLKKDGLPFVTATHDVKNPRSGGVMRQLGMRYQYSYEELWQPKNRLVTFRMYQLNLDGQEERAYQKYWNESSVHFTETDL